MRTPPPVPRSGPDSERGTTNVIDALNWDWRHRYELGTVRAPRTWAADADLAGYRYVVEALAALDEPSTPAARREVLLVALADRAAGGDREATRVVVQHLLPCLVHDLGRPRGATTRSREETLHDLVSAAWQTVAEGVDRRGRPMKIALLRRIENRALLHPWWTARRDATHEALGDPPQAAAPVADLWGRPLDAGVSAEEELLALLVDAARAGLDPADLRLLASLTLGGDTLEDAAAAEGVTVRTIRLRRARAARRLAQRAA